MFSRMTSCLKKSADFVKNTVLAFVSSLNATGGGGIYVRTHRVFFGGGRGCHPEHVDPCNHIIGTNSGFITLVLAWTDYFLQWIPLKYSRSNSAYKLSLGWLSAIDIIAMWNFFLYFSLFSYSAKQDDISEKVFSGISIACLFFAFLTNPLLREKIKFCLYRPDERGKATIMWDGICGFVRGFSSGRAMVVATQSFQHQDVDYEQKVRLGIAIAWGLYSMIIDAIYSPQAKIYNFFQLKNWLGLFVLVLHRGGGFFAWPITFGLFNYGQVKNSNHQIILSTGFFLLIPAAMIHAYFKQSLLAPAALVDDHGHGYHHGGDGSDGDDDNNDDGNDCSKKNKKKDQSVITVVSASSSKEITGPLLPAKSSPKIPPTRQVGLNAAMHPNSFWKVEIRPSSDDQQQLRRHSQRHHQGLGAVI